MLRIGHTPNMKRSLKSIHDPSGIDKYIFIKNLFLTDSPDQKCTKVRFRKFISESNSLHELLMIEFEILF